MDGDKTKQRRAALAARRAMSTAARASADAKICFRLLALPELQGYISNPGRDYLLDAGSGCLYAEAEEIRTEVKR